MSHSSDGTVDVIRLPNVKITTVHVFTNIHVTQKTMMMMIKKSSKNDFPAIATRSPVSFAAVVLSFLGCHAKISPKRCVTSPKTAAMDTIRLNACDPTSDCLICGFQD